jgi:outer membrane protein assembly factor BamB
MESAQPRPAGWSTVVVWLALLGLAWIVLALDLIDVSGFGTEHWLGISLVVLIGWHLALRFSRLRRMPIVRILVATVATIAWGRLVLAGDVDRQDANVLVPVLGTIGLVHLLVWALLARRAARRTRYVAGLLPVVFWAGTAAAFGSGLARVERIDGNLRPVVVFGRSADEGHALPAASGLVDVLDPSVLPGLADSLEFFGGDRRGGVEAPRIARDWRARPPEEMWRVPVGAAWSGFAVVGRRALTFEQFDEGEAVVCRDVRDGSVLWVHLHADERYDDTVAGVGARSTPVVVREGVSGAPLVFAMGATGILACLRVRDGGVVWSCDLRQRFGSPIPEWGFAASPLLVETSEGRSLVVVPAGSPAESGAEAGRDAASALVALDAATGETVWAAGREAVHWSSPVLVELAGVRQILIFDESLRAHDVDTGSELWSFPWPGGHPHVALPVAVDEAHVVLGSGYGTGVAKLHVQRDGSGAWQVERVWRSVRMKPKFANFVACGSNVYGYDDGRFACIDLDQGQRRWKQRGDVYDHGQVLKLADDLLLATTEWGEVALVEPTPEAHRELTRFRALESEDGAWNPPTLAGRYLLCRSHKEAACFRLPLAE